MIYVRQSTQVTQNGVGFLGLLTIAFIVLKLIGYIQWSWWLVTLPLWIVPVLVFGILLIAGIVWLVIIAGQAQGERARRRNRARAS